MLNYQDYNDYELISLAQELNEDATEILYQKYKPLIINKSLRYFNYLKTKGFDLSDLIQEGYIILDYAIKTFNQNNDNIFYTYFIACLDNHLTSQIRKSSSIKNKVLNESISLETEDDNELNLLNVIQDNNTNPEYFLTNEEEYSNLCNRIIEKLTNLEETVFLLKIQSFTYQEIASILDKDLKSIDNAIQRIKVKINMVLN